MSDFQKVQLFTINTNVSVDMKHDIYSIEVPEDQIEEFKAKEEHAEGEVRVLDDKILAKAAKKDCTRFFSTFIKAHLTLISAEIGRAHV